ncbi:hypothetical protein CBL_07969 [Carabus blaptoides fortunei]
MPAQSELNDRRTTTTIAVDEAKSCLEEGQCSSVSKLEAHERRAHRAIIILRRRLGEPSTKVTYELPLRFIKGSADFAPTLYATISAMSYGQALRALYAATAASNNVDIITSSQCTLFV